MWALVLGLRFGQRAVLPSYGTAQHDGFRVVACASELLAGLATIDATLRGGSA
jgi:hypothetical protein